MSVSKKIKTKQAEEDLNSLTKEELIDRVQRLTAHNSQLKNVISKKCEEKNVANADTKKKKIDFTKYSKRHIFIKLLYFGWDYQGYATQEDTNKTIEWELFEALRKSCLIDDRTTSNYHRCGRTDKGVSAFGQVISIDVRSKLLRTRVDNSEVEEKPAGEVGLGKAIGSCICVQDSHAHQTNEETTSGELEYCKILNRLLPPSIRAIAWSPVPPDESARFNCRRRTYKYFFPRGNLNIQSMIAAGEHLVGEHDFRNLCKMDVANGVINFQRRILSVSIKVVAIDQPTSQVDSKGSDIEDETLRNDACLFNHVGENVNDDYKNCQKLKSQSSSQDEASGNKAHAEPEVVDVQNGANSCCGTGVNSLVPSAQLQCSASEVGFVRRHFKESLYDMCELTIVGQAFLWHQIRCIMTVLFLVGEGKEDPSVVKHLLDVENCPRKPQYSLASEIPLNLFATDFESSLNWVYDRASIFSVIKDLQREWTMMSVRAAMIRQMLSDLDNENAEDWDGSELTNCLTKGVRPRSYVPLLKRDTCESLEDRIDHYVKRKRLELEVSSEK